MKTKGIRISDIKDGKCIPLGELLETISDETQFFWAWLWLDVTPLENEGHYLVELQKKINQSEDGLTMGCKLLRYRANFSEKYSGVNRKRLI